MDFRFQGLNARSLFHGNSANHSAKVLYGESAHFFGEVIKENLSIGAYTILDLGSSSGEFLEDLVSELKGYDMQTLAVDANEEDLAINKAQKKIIASLDNLPIEDKTVDITVARYAIAWNSIDKQKDILKEIARVTKKIAIIQHQGADAKTPVLLQTVSKELFSGIVPALKREGFYFSSSEEIQLWFTELGLNFEKIQDRKIDCLSDIYIEKYQLSKMDAENVKKILTDTDYIMQTTWILKF